jgi:AraC-like DNA-binding protein
MIIKFFDVIDDPDSHVGLAKTVDSLEKSIGLFITVHDMRGILSDDNGNFLFPGRLRHGHPYCVLGRYSTRNWNTRCINDCQREVESIAAKELRPFLHHCWKGVTEIVVPVVRNGTLMMILYAGVFKYGRRCLDGKFRNVLGEEYGKLPALSLQEVEGINEILSLAGQGMLAYILNRANAAGQASTRKEQIRKYLIDNAHGNASLQALAKCLCLSVSRTRHLAVACFGRSFQVLLLEERMTRSRNLLLSSEASLQDIAVGVGIPNVYYFNRCFKKFFGEPPGAFRRRRRKT